MHELWGWFMHVLGGFFNYLRSDIVPLAPLIAAVAVVVAGLTYVQKTRNGRADQNWKRIQWAVDCALSEDQQTRSVGIRTMEVVLDEGGVDSRDYAILKDCLIAVGKEDVRSGAPGSEAAKTRNIERVALSFSHETVDNELIQEVVNHDSEAQQRRTDADHGDGKSPG